MGVYESSPLSWEVVAYACGQLEFMQLDVSSMASVVAFVTAFRSGHERLDVLINNAGVMLKVSHRPLIGPFGLRSMLAMGDRTEWVGLGRMERQCGRWYLVSASTRVKG